ncbi:MAG: FAD-linked oxidase C-terminal domain-containing protein [Gemmatimonadota bacterium]
MKLMERMASQRRPSGSGPDDLRKALEGAVEGEVRFEAGDRALYAADASNYREVPIGVVLPRTREDVIATVRVCRDFDVPVLMRGGGTSLAGQCCNAAVVIDTSKYFNRILEIDPDRRIARVEPGARLDDLRDAAAPHGLTFGPDPATHRWCTLGGMIGNNSCGVHSIMARFHGPGPRTEHQVEELEVLTYDGEILRVGETPEAEVDEIIRAGGRRGEIYRRMRELRDREAPLIRERFPPIPRRVSGYNLDQLLPENDFHVARALVGSECTCVNVLEATVRLIPDPPCRTLLVAAYPTVFEAGDHVPQLLQLQPLAIEGIDDLLVEFLRKSDLHEEAASQLLADAGAWLLVEFGGETQEEADRRADEAKRLVEGQEDAPVIHVYASPQVQEEVWAIRESGLAATAWVPGEDDSWPGWEDSAVPPEAVGLYLRGLRSLFDKYGYRAALYGHFGDGCIHCRINFELSSDDGVARYRAFLDEAADLVLEHGGSLSGEHGDGQARAELLERMYGTEIVRAFREFKSIWDPDWRMNPGKVVQADSPTEDLRIGPEVTLPDVETHFKFPNDDGSFARAAQRCVGVGQCRKTDGGTMCPSYMVLAEEKHTTRGRAHLLFEMLVGDPVRNGWGDEYVKESLDLCLSCKGCKSECPVDVDVATYKAEFLAHYYEENRRPLSAHAFGNIDLWSRLAATAPDLANLLVQMPGVADLGKAAIGVARERRIPRFAARTFRQWWEQRPAAGDGGQRVILWPDTFNNHFHPSTAIAAVEVLEDAGCAVALPEAVLCCGRPLYEFGMLGRAKRLLLTILDTMRDDIRAGIPIVGLEPSCVAVFRDELCELFPDDPDARRLSQQVFTLAEFLGTRLDGYKPPRMHGKAIVHGHCHHKSVLGFDSYPELLASAGLDVDVLDSGCCGMAGAFGFEKEKYDVSIAAGERVVLPAVRAADAGTMVVADGFSCREQIAQQTERQALHLAEVLQRGIRDAAGTDVRRSVSAGTPEAIRGATSPVLGAAALFGAVVVGSAITRQLRRLL